MSGEFRREYLIRLPLPLAQLYCRAHNAKDGRGRHDNCFYLFESLIKLTSAPLVAAYIEQLRQDGNHAIAIDRLLVHLALPSLGQWCGILRESARYFSEREGAHPLGHVWQQLNEKRRDLDGLLALFRRIKNGPEGTPAGDQSCSLLQLIEVMVTYRNAVFGHGAGRLSSFYEEEMGPLMFPAANDVLTEGVLDFLGPRGSRLVCLREVKVVGHGTSEVGVRELVGLQGERSAPLILNSQQASHLLPNRIAVLWPGRVEPLLLSPLLSYRETEISEDVLFLNRDRNRKQVEFLSYLSGETTRDKEMSQTMNAFLELVSSGKQDPQDASLAKEEPEASDYEILAELGRGGMGIVYLARQVSLGRIVALKMLPPELQHDDVALTRFRREMRALGRCEHPNVVKVISCGTMPSGESYYAMEYVPGANLEQTWMEHSEASRDINVSSLTEDSLSGAVLSASHKLRNKTIENSSAAAGETGAKPASTAGEQVLPAPADDLPLLPRLPKLFLPDAIKSGGQRGGYARGVVRIMRDAASALQAVHDQNIVHRDVKPANLVLTPDGKRVVLMDFGLAKGEGLDGAATEAGGFLGTLRYAAPEQLASATMTVGPPADVRGLGVTLWELLTRRKLFGECQDELQLARAVNEQDVPRLRSVDPTFDRDLEAIVSRATERRALDRIQTARELGNYLDLYLQDKPLPIRTPGLTELLGRWVRVHKALVGTVAAACLVVLVTVIAAFVMITSALHQERLAKDEATRNFQVAQDSIDEWLIDVRYVMNYYPGLDVTRKQLLNKAAAEYEEFTRKKSKNRGLQLEFAKSFIRLGDVRWLLGEDDKARAAYEAAEAAFTELAASDPKNPEIRRQLANTYTGQGMLFGLSQQYDAADEAYQRGVDILDELLATGNDDPKVRDARARNLNTHAMLFSEREELDQAECMLRDAVAEFKRVADSTGAIRYRRRLFAAHIDLGKVLARQAKYAEVVDFCRAAIDGYQELLRQDAGFPEHLNGLATVQIDLAHALREIDPQAALAAYADAIATYEALASQNSDKLFYFESLAIARLNRARILHEFGLNQEAAELGWDALQVYRFLVESVDPDHVPISYREGTASNLQLLGQVAADLGINDEAPEFFASAIVDQYEKLVSDDPSNKDYRLRLADCRAEYGRLLHQLGQHNEAQQAFRTAIRELGEAGEVTEDVADVKARVQTYEGDLALQLGQLPDAVTAYLAALELRERLTTRSDHQDRLARLLVSCQHTELRDPDRAIELARQATTRAPHNGDYWNTLAAAYYRVGELDKSLAALKTAQQQRLVDDCCDEFYLSMVYWRQDKQDAARAYYERAVKSMAENRAGDVDAIRLHREAAELLGLPAT